MNIRQTLLAASLLFSFQLSAQLRLVSQCLENEDNEPAPVHPVPHERQIKWQETEFYAFYHYGMNTYTDKEWGYGNENPDLFAPSAVPDCMQWLSVARDAGMKGGIAVVKHHDGFCLWDTKTTDHKCTSSDNINAKNTNVPRDFADAARKLGMKYGFYVSPWDRNSAYYGTDRYVSDVFLRQCAELAEYGTDQFEMWFDGANGGDGYYGGSEGTRKIDASVYYDIPNLRDTVHKVCPDCVMWGLGGEARWIGNEQGFSGETIWSAEDRGTAPESNGMRGTEDGWFWLPGESDAKISDSGWFWHKGEKIKSAERLFQMYLETVGRNATLILNIAPDVTGRIPRQTASGLRKMGRLLRKRFGKNLALKAAVAADNERRAGRNRCYKAANINDGNKDTYWAADDGKNSGVITFSWTKEQKIRYVVLQEYIRLGQRVRGFKIETSSDGISWTRRGGSINTTTIGYKRIIPLNGSTENSYDDACTARYLRITLTDCKSCPAIQNIEIY